MFKRSRRVESLRRIRGVKVPAAPALAPMIPAFIPVEDPNHSALKRLVAEHHSGAGAREIRERKLKAGHRDRGGAGTLHA